MDEQRKLEREGSEEDAYDVGDAFGEHNIEYWVYDGTRLIPASPDEQERLREWEQRILLEQWKAIERRRERALARRRPWIFARRGLPMLAAWLRGARHSESATSARRALPSPSGGIGQPEQPIRRVSDVSES